MDDAPLVREISPPYMRARLWLLGLRPQMMITRDVLLSLSSIIHCLSFSMSSWPVHIIVSLHAADDRAQCVYTYMGPDIRKRIR